MRLILWWGVTNKSNLARRDGLHTISVGFLGGLNWQSAIQTLFCLLFQAAELTAHNGTKECTVLILTELINFQYKMRELLKIK